MIADQNVKFEKKIFSISRRFLPWSLSVKHGCEPQQTVCIDGSWLEEHKSGFKFYVEYSMMKIRHLEVTYLFYQNCNFWSAVMFLDLPLPQKIKPFLDSLKKEFSKNVYFYYGRVYTFQVVSL